jgi:hypothetical protein
VDQRYPISEQHETLVGERGVTLSSQKQRVSHCPRADQTGLIFDDCLSAADAKPRNKLKACMKFWKIRLR